MSSCCSEVVLPLSSSLTTHVTYSCGSCGYELNLNSCNRNTSVIDESYGKSMKKGMISFFSIDESRFTQISRVRWLPYIASSRRKRWKLFQRRTKLLCRSCGACIGAAWNVDDRPPSSSSSSGFRVGRQWDGICGSRTYEIKIRCLKPLLFEGSSDMLFI